MIAAYHLILWGDRGLLDAYALSPLLTFAVLIGGAYGVARLVFDLALAVRWFSNRPPGRPGPNPRGPYELRTPEELEREQRRRGGG